MSREVKITKATYIGGYKIELSFTDGKKNEVNFQPFLEASSHPEVRKYLDVELFKTFSVVDGDLDWNDFDLVFPIFDLYSNKILKSEKRSVHAS
jgi:hypothetical protein